MRITIAQGAFLPVPPTHGGAVEKVWFQLGKLFAAKGHEVTHVSRLCDDLPAEETIAGVRHLRVPGYSTPSSILKLKFLDLLYSRRAKQALPDADVLVTNTFWLPIILRDLRKGQRYVHVGRFPRGQMRLYRGAARLHAPSTAIAEAIRREVPGLAPCVRSIPYPLPWKPLSLDKVAGARESIILYVGRIAPEKGLNLLVRAYVALPEELREKWKLRIIGPAEVSLGGAGRTYLGRLRERAAPVASRVEFPGPVFDENKLRSELGRASLFVYPSIAEQGETFGLAPLEAMSCGCPALVSGLACFRDFIEAEKDGFVFDHKADNPAEALSLKLRSLLENPEKLKIACEPALRKATQFEASRVADAFLADFEELLANEAS
ncbi:MAG: glycosyltransferase family 4 protein [Opitutales bacterium]